VLLAGLSTGHKIGLAVVGAAFIAFALASSFLAPRRRPDFPGRNGLSVFVLVSFAFFAAMLTAVVVFGVESEAEGASPKENAAPVHAIAVKETEFKILLPATKELGPGEYTFRVTNVGKLPHDLALEGPRLKGETKTSLIKPGGSAKLTLPLDTGNYTLYCSVPGHRAAGMVAKLTVG
jgi:plastocyanin